MKLPIELAEHFGVQQLSKEENEKIGEKLVDLISGSSSKYLVVKGTLMMAKAYGIPVHKRLQYLKMAGKIYKEEIGSVPLINGAEEIVDFLKNDQNIPVAINTTSSREELMQRFENRMEFLEKFDNSIITRTDVKKMKPSPESILKISENWNIPSQKLIMVGDMSVDILAGKNAGTTTIGVLTGFSNLKLMKKCQPDFIFKDVSEIKENWEEITNSIH